MKQLPLMVLAAVCLACVGCESVNGYSATVRTKYGNVSYSNDGKTMLR